MTGTWQKTYDWLQEQLAYEEDPGNRTKYAQMAGHRNGLAWCASFVAAALRENSVPVPKQILVPSSRTMFVEAKKAGLEVPLKAVRPGDVLHMRRGASKLWLGHVAFCVEAPSGGLVITLDGNTNPTGSATGGGVFEIQRKFADWNIGAWRPKYS